MADAKDTVVSKVSEKLPDGREQPVATQADEESASAYDEVMIAETSESPQELPPKVPVARDEVADLAQDQAEWVEERLRQRPLGENHERWQPGHGLASGKR